jgi:hypothetical protein
MDFKNLIDLKPPLRGGLEGLHVDYLLSMKNEIEEFEKKKQIA